MGEARAPADVHCGLAVIHGNRLETLADVLQYWLKKYPLAPLENDIVLVQSNGMGQWLKHTLADTARLGIAASISLQLPSLFVWQAYRAVIGQGIAVQQPLAKLPLCWRLYRLLPLLVDEPGFDALHHFLKDDHQDRKRHQLAEQLADLYDQYQVYRADWLADWQNGVDRLNDGRGHSQPLPDAQRWQAALWRCILADLPDTDRDLSSRASVHQRFLHDIDRLDSRPPALPRRIVVFGLSSLPQQTLEVLVKLGRFCQIVLFIHNPCQYYWADIVEDKELLKAERRRHACKPGHAPSLHPEDQHQNTHPLLAAWGKQGRDYIRLLDQFDDSSQYADWPWPDNKIDVFQDYGTEEDRSLLQRLQQSLLDLEPLPDSPQALPAADDSMVFHIAHSPQREVEILHDQLLARFNAASDAGQSISTRDIVVMVPDIHRYAPHIRAVFGQFGDDDPRHIPFSIADQQQRGYNPLLVAVEYLLNLPDARFSVGECLDLLEATALRKRFGLDADAVNILRVWLQGSGVRWGLSPEHRRQTSGMPETIDANTWTFGLRRLLLGFAVGDGEAFQAIEPFEDIGGLDAQWLGNLWQLLDTLQRYRRTLNDPKGATDWHRLLDALLVDFFEPDDDQDRATLAALSVSLTAWRQACAQGGLTESDQLPLAVVRDAWLAMFDEPKLHQRFLSGRVNFCTLMPMRAIPFRVVCLLGMNDGDYPRSHFPHSFDLMAQRGHYRPGDRSRRDDDQYLFLEALLSARETLYISWVGRSIRDNTVKPPSVLVGQLRDAISQRWQLTDGDLLSQLTVEHPLQPFSTAYVRQDRDPRLFTYAREWFEASNGSTLPETAVVADSPVTDKLPLTALAHFLRAPVKSFCLHRLKFRFEIDDALALDDETFGFDRLDSQIVGSELLQNLMLSDDIEQALAQHRQSLGRQGRLPLAAFGDVAFEHVSQPARQTRHHFQSLTGDWPDANEAKALMLDKTVSGVPLQVIGETGPLYAVQDGLASCHCTVQPLLKKDGLDHVRLLPYWPVHLAANAGGMALRSFIIGSDGIVMLERMPQSDAVAALKTLAEAWQTGMTQPLPIACRTALVWLTAGDESADAARKTYEGEFQRAGEVDYDPYLARFYPNFDHLVAACDYGDFSTWAERLYRPLVQAAHAWTPGE